MLGVSIQRVPRDRRHKPPASGRDKIIGGVSAWSDMSGWNRLFRDFKLSICMCSLATTTTLTKRKLVYDAFVCLFDI